MNIKRQKVLNYPNTNFAGTWMICLIVAFVSSFLAYALLISPLDQWGLIIAGLVLAFISVNYYIQTYLWFRVRDKLRQQQLVDAKYEIASNRELVQYAKRLVTRKRK